MIAFVVCLAIQIVGQTNAGLHGIGAKLVEISGIKKLLDEDWIEYDNFCVSQFNKELIASPMPAGDLNIKDCRSICESNYDSKYYCTAIEWYENGWNDVKCFLILDDIPASKGFDGPRRRDATCHVKSDCSSNKDCPWYRPICLGAHGGKCVLNGQSPYAQGCWIKYPSGCPRQINNSKYKNLQDGRIWNRDTYNGASTSRDKCSARQGPINNWCGVSDVITIYVSGTCQPRDSDTCIKEAWKDWDWTLGCEKSNAYDRDYCETWGKDMRRCCPESCKIEKFTKEDCDVFPGDGTCRFPTSATLCNDVILSPCHEKKCGLGCYFPNQDKCFVYGKHGNTGIHYTEDYCLSKGGIDCREICKNNEDCKNIYGNYVNCNRETNPYGPCIEPPKKWWHHFDLSAGGFGR